MLNRWIKSEKEGELKLSPLVDIQEYENKIIMSVEMPGVDSQTLDVSLHDDELTIKGMKVKENIPKKYTSLLQERMIAEYYRVFRINADIEEENIAASYENGILTIELLKTKKPEPKRIEIKVG